MGRHESGTTAPARRRLGRIVAVAAVVLLTVASWAIPAAAAFDGAIFSTSVACDGVNVNVFDAKSEVYLDGGPQNPNANGLPEGDYFVQVTTPSGDVLGKTITASVHVNADGNFAVCYQLTAILFTASSGFTVNGYDDTTNPGGEYKVWLSPQADFPPGDVKTDNFKVLFDTATTTEVHDAAHADITNTSVPAGTIVHDQATVTSSTVTPSGDVSFGFFTNGTCTGTAFSTEVVALDGNGVAETTPFAPAAGSYSYLATYLGTGTHHGSVAVCEPFTVTGSGSQLASTVTTEVHNAAHTDITNGSVPVGTPVHDEATVTGAGPTPTGTVTFDFYDETDCGGEVVSSETNLVLVNGVVESAAKTALGVGAYGYLAHYSGDANYLPDDGICEPFSVIEVAGTITVTLNVDKEVVGADPPDGTQFGVHVVCTGAANIDTTLTFTFPNGLGVQQPIANQQIPAAESVSCTVTETNPGGQVLLGYRIDGGAIQGGSTVTLDVNTPTRGITVVNDPSRGIEVLGSSATRLGTLPFTGGSTWLLLVAIPLLGAGAALTILARRRRPGWTT